MWVVIMQIRCTTTEGYLLTVKEVRHGNQTKTVYRGLTVGNSYTVYAIILYQEGIKYLIYDDFSMANWYPAELFKVINNGLPSEWHYQFYGYEEFGVTAIWGYKELVLTDEHYDGLCEQEPQEIQVFLSRKNEIDNQS
jgi:hypothetical protein